RLHASVENERLLLGLATQLYRPPVEFTQRLGLGDGPVDGIDEMTAQLREDTAIRLLLADPRATDRLDLACQWAQEWVDRLQGRGRYRALLRTQRTLAECLAVAGRTVAAKQLLCSILASCADAGMIRFPIDGGDRLTSLIAEVRDEDPPPSLAAFLDETLAAATRTVDTAPGKADGRTV
ncbi:MAG TPA: hypothetical protein VFR27_14355, partial [Mycobacterium sp.]|nr:hypothetical protein [Mycobacterium sp.]